MRSPSRVESAEDEGFESEEESESVAAFSPALSRVLDEVDDGLLALAEAGLASSEPTPHRTAKASRPSNGTTWPADLKLGLENIANNPHAAFVLRAAI